DIQSAMGTAADILNRANETESIYRHAFEQFASLVDVFGRIRAAGCKCPNGQPTPPDGNCNPPPPPDPPKPPPPPDDPDDPPPDPSVPPDDHSSSTTDFTKSTDPNSIAGPA